MKLSGIFFIIALEIVSEPSVLLFARFLKQMSYVSLSKYSCCGICGLPFLSIVYPSKSCHGYCLTPHVHFGAKSVC